ncbi:hypothetical protein [Mangrovibacterium marinum]|uniref:TonB dependent receptor n=1 Tax=Mangrovibacterium marinum TaxID=1639118 RepID=A0A2T5C0I6_9BACT|nr:hypothetical protein [Mangrovibacterium marinum]PTN08125.1 hypothetical protein C8N47_11011 [Mangrovibacterium marinum]
MRPTYYKHIILTGLLGLALLPVSAQQDSTKLHKEVEVVKAYKPTISDAYKINERPVISQPTTDKPAFDYQIKTQPMLTTFSIHPVEAARMKPEPAEPLNQGLLKLGVGNYFSQYGEFFYNAQASRSTELGVHLKADLSNGKVKLDNGDKVKAPDNESLAELFINNQFRKGSLKTKLFFEHKSFRYYGYTGEKMSDENKAAYLSRWNEKQAFPKGGLSISYAKKYDPRAPLNFNTGLTYQYMDTKTGQNEQLVKWDGHFTAPIDLMEGVLDAGISYSSADSVLQPNATTSFKRNMTIVKVNPAARFDSQVLKFTLGINSYTVFEKNEDADYMLAPNINIAYTADILTLYAGLNGYLKPNNYSAIAAENPFIRPDQNIRNTKHQYILTGGLKGKFLPQFSYNFNASYASIKDEHFYYLRNSEITEDANTARYRDNTFAVLYDKLKQLTIGGELFYNFGQEFDFRIQAKYHSYTLDHLQEAWLKPNFESSASLFFKPEGPLKFTVDLYYIGARKALTETTHTDMDDPSLPTPTTSTELKNMDAIIDLNVGAEYQFKPNLSFWGRINNFAFQKYEFYPGYTNQNFSIMAGISFSF